jgi:two-component system response regulator DegU
MDAMKIKVLIVDDHQMFRDGLKALLTLHNELAVVGEAQNGQEAVILSRELRPDIILMDINMPVMDGVEATRRILAETPDMKILALSVNSDDGFRTSMMRAGAVGYIMKGGDSGELWGAIRRVAGSGNP